MRMPRTLLSVVASLLMLGIASAQTRSATAEKLYSFHTLLVPQDMGNPTEGQITTGSWVSGSMFADRSARLEQDISNQEGSFQVPSDQVLAIARANMLIACTIDRISAKGGKSHICFADTNDDFQIDSWFLFADEIALFPFMRRVPFEKMKSIKSVFFHVVDNEIIRNFRTSVGFMVLPQNGRLEFCRTYKGKNDYYCTHSGQKLDNTGKLSNISFLGGQFEYRRVGNRYEVRVIIPISVQVFEPDF